MEDGGVGEHTVHVSSRCVRGASEKFFWSACWALAEGLGHLGGWEESQRNLYFRKKKNFFFLFCLVSFPGRVWEGSGEQWMQDRTSTPGGSWGRGINPTLREASSQWGVSRERQGP